MSGAARMHRMLGVAAVCAAVSFASLSLGCDTTGAPYESRVSVENRGACGADGCHANAVTSQVDGGHKDLTCIECHPGSDGAHSKDPKSAKAVIEWRIDGCSGCHKPEAATYLYDDNAQAGPFGGSVRAPKQPKVETFPLYNTIIAGQGFTKEYNEEGAHRWMFQDHYDITRGKYETCIQCKSTKVVWAWKYGKPLAVSHDTDVALNQTASKGVPAKHVTIPKGTVVTFGTDAETREVKVAVKMPDGTTFTSQPKHSDDATKNFNMTWASTYAVTAETMPYGAGCNHCHDPHSTRSRVMRASELEAIASGGPDGKGGLNPYGTPSQRTKSLDSASKQDRLNTVCAQCHVEYTCGKSGVDKIDRDDFGWSKARDLHEVYMQRFGYKQDWRHAIIGEPLIKSQHPESETYWNSNHYRYGVACADCHMPEVRTLGGDTFRSHWMTSPYKYADGELFSRFASETALDPSWVTPPCARCHEDRLARGIAMQGRVFERQKPVQQLLARSISAIAATKKLGAGLDTVKLTQAIDKHRRAHVLWENLIVSENSMGFHDYDGVMADMADAERLATEAIALATAARPAPAKK